MPTTTLEIGAPIAAIDINMSVTELFGQHLDPLNVLQDELAFKALLARFERDFQSPDDEVKLAAAQDFFRLRDVLARYFTYPDGAEGA
jgi:hypothetical protein